MKINKAIFLLAISNFLFCFGLYVTLPVLALYFNMELQFSLVQVGIILGIAPLVSSIFGSFGAVIAKKIGIINCLIVGIIFTIIPYVFYLSSENYILLLILSTLAGLGGVCWKPLIRSLFAYHSKGLPNKDVVFRVNYIVICTAAIAGPSISLLLSSFPPSFNLIISICSFLSIIVILVLQNAKLRSNETINKSKSKITLRSIKSINYVLVFYILAGLVVFTVFSQFEGVLPLALNEISSSPSELFAVLLIINSIAGILIQLLVMYIERKARKINSFNSALIGNLGFVLAFIVFALSGGNIFLLIVATIIFAAGEVYAVPGSDMLINDISTDENRNLYFGFAEFRFVGFSIGPILGTFILEIRSINAFYISCSLLVLVACVFYLIPKFPKTSRETRSKSAHY